MKESKGFVYIIYDHKHNVCKIGHTIRDDSLKSRYRFGTMDHMELVICVDVGDRYYRDVERLVQNHLEPARSPQEGRPGQTEWFAISYKDAEFIAKMLSRFARIFGRLPNDQIRRRLIEHSRNEARRVNALVQYGER